VTSWRARIVGDSGRLAMCERIAGKRGREGERQSARRPGERADSR
jgi:hypothetical protein